MMNSIQVLRRSRWMLFVVGTSFTMVACENQQQTGVNDPSATAIRAQSDPALEEQNRLFNQQKEMFIAETARLQALEAQKNSAKADLLNQQAEEDKLEGTKFTQTETTKRAQIAADAQRDVAETENGFMKNILGQGPMGALGQYFQANARSKEADARLEQIKAQNLLQNENLKRQLEIDAKNAENQSLIAHANAAKLIAEARRTANNQKAGSWDQTIEQRYQSDVALEKRAQESVQQIKDMETALTRYESAQKRADKSVDRSNLSEGAERYLNGLVDSAPTDSESVGKFIKQARSDVASVKDQALGATANLQNYNEFTKTNIDLIKSDPNTEVDWEEGRKEVRKLSTDAIGNVDAVGKVYFNQAAPGLAENRDIYGDSTKKPGTEDAVRDANIARGLTDPKLREDFLATLPPNQQQAVRDLLAADRPETGSSPGAGLPPGTPPPDVAAEVTPPVQENPPSPTPLVAGVASEGTTPASASSPASAASGQSGQTLDPTATTNSPLMVANPNGGVYYQRNDGKIYRGAVVGFGRFVSVEVTDEAEKKAALDLINQNALAASGDVTVEAQSVTYTAPVIALGSDGTLRFNSNGASLPQGSGNSLMTAEQKNAIQTSLQHVNSTADLLNGVTVTDLADYKDKAKSAIEQRFDLFEKGLKGIKGLNESDKRAVDALVARKADLLEKAKADIEATSSMEDLSALIKSGNFATAEKANTIKVSSASSGGGAAALQWTDAPAQVAKALSPKPLVETCSQFDSECSGSFGSTLVWGGSGSSSSGSVGVACDRLAAPGTPGACT